MSTRKSHKAKRLWKRPSEPGNPESQAPVVGSTSSSTDPEATAGAMVPSSNPIVDILNGETDKPGRDAKDTPTGDKPVVVLPPPLPAKPYWWRPDDSKCRKHAEKILVLRGAGHDDATIAKKLKMTEQGVRQYVYLARKNHWVDDNGEMVDLEAKMSIEVDRKVVRNINHALDGGMTNWQTHEMTLAAAKGRGIFKSHDAAEGSASVQIPVVAIQVIMPALGAEQQVVNEANVGGVPAFTDGEVISGLQLGQAGDAANQTDVALTQLRPDAVSAGSGLGEG